MLDSIRFLLTIVECSSMIVGFSVLSNSVYGYAIKCLFKWSACIKVEYMDEFLESLFKAFFINWMSHCWVLISNVLQAARVKTSIKIFIKELCWHQYHRGKQNNWNQLS